MCVRRNHFQLLFTTLRYLKMTEQTGPFLLSFLCLIVPHPCSHPWVFQALIFRPPENEKLIALSQARDNSSKYVIIDLFWNSWQIIPFRNHSVPRSHSVCVVFYFYVATRNSWMKNRMKVSQKFLSCCSFPTWSQLWLEHHNHLSYAVPNKLVISRWGEGEINSRDWWPKEKKIFHIK